MGNNAVLLGGNWNEAANSGSRCSNWNNSATNSNVNIGARGVCDDVIKKVSTELFRIYGAASRPVNHGINFLGYRIWPTHKLLRKSSVTRAKRKIANYSTHHEQDRLTRFLASWQGHASWADSHNLLNHLESRYALN